MGSSEKLGKMCLSMNELQEAAIERGTEDGRNFMKSSNSRPWDKDATTRLADIVYGHLADEPGEIMKSVPMNHMITDVTEKAGEMLQSLQEGDPHSSISNVLVSLTIHDNTKIFLGDVTKKHETIVEGQRLFQPNIIGLSLCLCLCVYDCIRRQMFLSKVADACN